MIFHHHKTPTGEIAVAWSAPDPAAIIRLANGITLGDWDYTPGWTPSKKWAEKAMLAEHSTLEWADLIIVSSARSDVISHIVRHTKGHPRHVVQSQRPDWTGEERKGPDSIRLYAGKWSPVSLIQMARQRLCSKAMNETREWVQELKKALEESGDTMMIELSRAMVPNCEYRGRCTEIRGCGRF